MLLTVKFPQGLAEPSALNEVDASRAERGCYLDDRRGSEAICCTCSELRENRSLLAHVSPSAPVSNLKIGDGSDPVSGN